MLGSLALSATAHAALVGALVLAGRFSFPAPPIPIEVVRPRPHAVRPPPPPPKPPAPPPAEKKVATINKEGSGGARKPKPVVAPPPSPAPETANLKPFAPDDANLVLLLCSEKLRASPHRANVEKLLGALPDYTTLLGGTGLSAIDDLDALLIATADPRSVIATFLAARYKDSERLRAVATRTMPPGDPRMFRTLRPGLTVLTQPDGAARLDDALAGRADAGDDPRVRWLRDLEQFDKVAQSSDGPALLVTIADAPALMRFGGGLPTPLAMALAMTGDGAPSVRLRAVFAKPEEAALFVASWPEILRRYRSATAFLGLSSALDGISIAQKETDVELTGQLPERQLTSALSLLASLVPRHRTDGGM
jgi:hypothetical protein